MHLTSKPVHGGGEDLCFSMLCSLHFEGLGSVCLLHCLKLAECLWVAHACGAQQPHPRSADAPPQASGAMHTL